MTNDRPDALTIPADEMPSDKATEPKIPVADALNAEDGTKPAKPRFELPEANQSIPDWAIVPKDVKLPRSKQVIFLRFRPGMTDMPGKGERQAIVWSNNLGDQRLAVLRADKDPNVLPEQLAKQMIRVIDGKAVDWTGEACAANIDVWWEEIGPKCRSILDHLYIQLHIANQNEMRDFFESCVAVRGVGG